MITGKLEDDYKEINFPEDINVSEDCKSMIRGLLKYDAKERFEV